MLKIPALPDELCPKCGAANHSELAAGASVWRVSTGHGLLYECDVCSFTWRLRDGVAVQSVL
jgi:rubredoxin